eukprot:5178042-Lingulodinium_polyedra.AAC.1
MAATSSTRAGGTPARRSTEPWDAKNSARAASCNRGHPRPARCSRKRSSQLAVPKMNSRMTL